MRETHATVERALSDDLEVNERQLMRRFRAGVGYGPKLLHRILRFQRIRAGLAADPDGNLAVAAAQAGYADQAHLTRDAVRLAGRPPGVLPLVARLDARLLVSASGRPRRTIARVGGGARVDDRFVQDNRRPVADDRSMTYDVQAATSFMATHARMLDQRRFQQLLGVGDTDATLAALAAYRNPDGGYGWGLEPDLRAPESQPTAGMHAFEVFAEVPATSPYAVALCDWLADHTLADGGLPFALPVAGGSGCAPFWISADPSVSAIQMTTQVAANAHRVAERDPAVAAHPWLARATRNCFDVIGAFDTAPHAYELRFALRFLDAASVRVPEAARLVAQLAPFVPADGMLAVAGGIEGETLRPLDLAPFPGRPSRDLIADDVIAADLEHLASRQEPDGGWTVDYAAYSPAAELEWRGYATVRAVEILRANGC